MLTVKSVADLNNTIVRHLDQVPRDVDAVVGVPRSGVIAASLIATHLQLPLAPIERLLLEPRILLVEDTVLKGRTMARVVQAIRLGDVRRRAIVRLAVYVAPSTPAGAVDVALETCPTPRVFAWNLWAHKRLAKWGLDMDGVLCRNPVREEWQQEAKYQTFLETAEPRFLPRKPIGWIVTGRLERYRTQTVAWLARHRVQYAGLIMMEASDRVEAHAQGHARWKADWYRRTAAELFIESDQKQAVAIAGAVGRPVWCTDTQTCYGGAA